MYTSHMKKGYALLVTILIVSALILSVSIGMASRVRNDVWTGFDILQGSQARVHVHACAQYVLLEMESTLHYSGNESILLENSTCVVSLVQELVGGKREVGITATNAGYTQRAVMQVPQEGVALDILSFEYVSEL